MGHRERCVVIKLIPLSHRPEMLCWLKRGAAATCSCGGYPNKARGLVAKTAVGWRLMGSAPDR